MNTETATAKASPGNQKAEQFVTENLEVVKAMHYKQLVKYGQDNGFDSRYSYPKYKAALKEVAGIDMEVMRQGWIKNQNEQRAAEFAQAGKVKLHVAASATDNRFAIANEQGEEVWRGLFFEKEKDEGQSTCEINAAKKAIFLAGKISEETGQKIHLELLTGHEPLEWANTGREDGGKSGGRANELNRAALKAGISLHVNFDAERENLAKAQVALGGHLGWKDGIGKVAVEEPAKAKTQEKTQRRSWRSRAKSAQGR